MAHIAIVGAGLGGISAAVRLQAAGYRVSLIEKNALPGGKINLVEVDGFRFDTGASLVTLPGVIASTFHAAATLSMIPYIEIAGGGWYIEGGIYRLVAALMEIAVEMGVNFPPNTEASEIVVEPQPGWRKQGKAIGVRFMGGSIPMVLLSARLVARIIR